MPRINLNGFDPDQYEQPRTAPRAPRTPKAKTVPVSTPEPAVQLVEEDLGDTGYFRPTLHASRYEKEWITQYLKPFYDDHHITDVLHVVKGGKEATVYCCTAHPATGLSLLAAKLYRPRAFRAMRNDALYRQGRAILDENGHLVKDDRALHAVAKKTRFGRSVEHTTWIEYEYQALTRLYAVGADVPRPVARGDNTILMEYLGESGAPAPTLSQVALERDEARELFERVLHNLGLMLQCQWVHGDLSAYNILYWDGTFKIIDFPQVVNPEDNTEAYTLFQRDVARLCQYFKRYGINPDAHELAHTLWSAAGLPDEHRRISEARMLE